MADLDRLPPSTTAYVVATAIIAGVTGYFLGQGSSLGLFSTKEKEGWPNSYNVKVHRDSSDEEGDDEDDDEEEEEDSEEEGDGGELASFENNNEEVKLVLVVRTDLGMTKGWSFFLSCGWDWIVWFLHLQPSSQTQTPQEMILKANAKLQIQEKSPPSAPMPPLPATNTSQPTRPTRRSCAAGNDRAKRRLRCRSNPRRSCNYSRRRPSVSDFARG